MLNKEINEKYGRSGKCNYKKCKAACCRFIHVGRLTTEREKFIRGFGGKGVTLDGTREAVIEIPCKYLDLKMFKCKRYSKRPVACKQFPIQEDGHYQLVRGVCSYIFKDKKVEKMD